MPRWHLSLPLPVAPTSPSRLHCSSSPIAVDSPSRHPLMSSCSRAIHCHPSPSITVHCHAAHHRQVAIARQVDITPSLSDHHHCDCSPSPSHSCCPSPYIAIKEPSRHPLPSIAVAPRRRSPSRSRPSLSIRLLLSSCRRSVHCCPSLLSRRRAVHRHRTAPSITVKSPLRHPLPSITRSRCPSLYRRRGAAAPSIAIKEPSRRPLTSRRIVH